MGNVKDCLAITNRLWYFRYSPSIVHNAHQFFDNVSLTMLCGIIMDIDRTVLWPSLRCASVVESKEEGSVSRGNKQLLFQHYFLIMFSGFYVTNNPPPLPESLLLLLSVSFISVVSC